MVIANKNVKFQMLVIYTLIFISSFSVLATSLAANEGTKNNENTNKAHVRITDEEIVSRRVKSSTNSVKLFGGENAGYIESIGMLMESSTIRYLSWTYCSDVLLFGDRCFLTSARCLVEPGSTVSPPPLDSSVFQQVYIPRPNCQVQYPILSVFLSEPYYNSTTKANSIAVLKTKRPVFFGNQCGGAPVDPSWVSCSPDGPEAGNTDCFATSYGEITSGQDGLPQDVIPKTVDMIILSPGECNAAASAGNTIPFTPEDQICAQTTTGAQPVCAHDLGPVLYCKHHWRNTPPMKRGGWSSPVPPKPDPLLAVGHWVTKNSGDYNCTGDPGAAIFVKYGSPTYKDLFAKCGYVCSNNLPRGYRCDGNPPSSLGPVYCHPVKIPSSSNGWSRNSAPPPKRNSWNKNI